MPLPQQPERRGRRVWTALIVALVLHALALPWVARDAVFHFPKNRKPMAVTMVSPSANQVQHAQNGPRAALPSTGSSTPQQQSQQKPPEPEPVVPQKMEGQIVSLGQPEDERAPDKPTKYLSEHDSRVLKETRARETSAFFKNALSKVQKEGRATKAPPGAPPPGEKATGAEGAGGGKQQKRAAVAAELPSKARQDAVHLDRSADGTVRDRNSSEAVRGEGKKLALADPGNEKESGSEESGKPGAAPGSAGAPGAKTPLKLTLDQPIGAMGPIAGGPMPDDLRGVEEGDATLLNSRSFKYAGFLNRVKEAVGRVWVQHVQDEAGRRDPTGQLFSYKDRRTLVNFTLDKNGEIVEVKVAASSGVPYLDQVAVDAFNIVQRFPNPPPGLVGDEGKVTLPFAFTLLAAQGGLRLQMGPAYLPGSPAARGF